MTEMSYWVKKKSYNCILVWEISLLLKCILKSTNILEIIPVLYPEVLALTINSRNSL